jgi:hypothetical protein
MIARRLAHRILTTVLMLVLTSLAVAVSASAAVITGTVTIAAGAPVGGSRVDALQVMGGGVYTLRASAFVSKTDGSYTITGLPEGTCVVRFQGNATFMREHYDDVPNRALGTPIAVTAGGTVSGVDAVLVPYPKLRGVVRSTTGEPIEGARVTVMGGGSEPEDQHQAWDDECEAADQGAADTKHAPGTEDRQLGRGRARQQVGRCDHVLEVLVV